jgi:hypothetical protein
MLRVGPYKLDDIKEKIDFFRTDNIRFHIFMTSNVGFAKLVLISLTS